MRACIRSTTLMVILAVTQPGHAWGQQRSRSITIEDYFTQVYVTGCVISPDGRRVAYVERRWQGPKTPSNTDLWAVDSRTKELERLTFDPGNDNNPCWSPDCKLLYFTSNRKREGEKSAPYDGTKQVWRHALGPGRQEPVTHVAGGIDAFRLSANGGTVYYTTSRTHTSGPWNELKDKFPDLKYGHGVSKVSELWKLDLASWRETCLYTGGRFIRSFDVSADGRVALITTPDEREITFEGQSQVDVLDTATSEIATLFPDDLWRKHAPSRYGWLEGLSWSRDGRFLAWGVFYDGYPSELLVADWGGGGPRVREMPRPKYAYLLGGITWRGPADEVCFLGDYHATKAVFGVRGIGTDNPTPQSVTTGDLVIDAVSFTAGGDQMAVLQTGMTYGPDIFLGKPGGEEDRTRLTNVNPQIDTWKLPKVERVTWKGANDDPVEGILELPPDYQPGKPLPLIVNLHGGPTASEYIGFQYWPYGRTLFAARGYAVIYPNYRGSTGYGDQFLTQLIGRENDIEVDDIVKGIDFLIDKKKVADRDRIGVMGWSNGGYLTNCLITGSDRFKAASSGAGVFDMTIQWAEEDTPGHVINYQQEFPWKQGAAYQKSSPLYQLKPTFNTPTLIHVGETDERVPASHSRALHRALHEYLNVATELVVYPNAGHTLMEYDHRMAKLKWDVAWFDKYLPAVDCRAPGHRP